MGCSKDQNGATYYLNDNDDIEIIPDVEETIVPTSLDNNCGGKCLIRTHVVNGIVKRFSSDERPTTVRDEELEFINCDCRVIWRSNPNHSLWG